MAEQEQHKVLVLSSTQQSEQGGTQVLELARSKQP